MTRYNPHLRRGVRSGKRCPTPLSAAQGVIRCGIVLVCIALAATACSSEPQAAVELPSAAVSATAESERDDTDGPPQGSGAEREEGNAQHDADWQQPPLAGMWVEHPEEMYPTVGWLHATVSIELPCVYLTDVSEGFVDESLANWANWKGRRLALSLRYPEVRFDENNQILWNPLWDYDIQIAHGDRVIVSSDPYLEDIGDKEPHELHLFWDVCSAHAVAVPAGLWASVEWLCSNKPPEWVWHRGEELERICVEDTRPWNQRDLLEQQGIAPAVKPPSADQSPGEPPPVAELEPPPFLDMHPYHPDMELELSRLVGILSIEPAPPNYHLERKCVYLYPIAASVPQAVLWGDSWKHTGPDGRPLAVWLELPYPQVRFDEDTWALWNGDIGPMTTGDRVIADPIAPPDFHTDGYNTRAKQPHEPPIHPCKKAGASATVLDIRTVEHYCTHDTPPRHQSQCEQAMSLRNQPQTRLTLPE